MVSLEEDGRPDGVHLQDMQETGRMLLRLAVPVVVEIAVCYPVAVRVCLFSITAPSGHPTYAHAEALRPAGASVKEIFFWCVEGTAERFWKRFLTPRHLPDDDERNALLILGCVSWGFPTLPPPSRLALGHARWPDPRPPARPPISRCGCWGPALHLSAHDVASGGCRPFESTGGQHLASGL